MFWNIGNLRRQRMRLETQSHPLYTVMILCNEQQVIPADYSLI